MTVGTEAHHATVLSKARQILDAFLDDDLDGSAVLSLTQLSVRSGVAKATVHRLCRELVEWGLLERAAPGTGYRLGLRLFEMGQRVPRRRLLREAALRPMEHLLAASGASVHLAVAAGHDALPVEELAGPRAARPPSAVAGRSPMHATAAGKVLLAFGPPALLAEVVRAGLHRVTPRTLTSPALLGAQRDRLAGEAEEWRPGRCAVAVPVSDGSSVVAALSLVAGTADGDLHRHVRALRAAAAATTRDLAARLGAQR
jgi:DNA-binding IclR family transcriptional regulator